MIVAKIGRKCVAKSYHLFPSLNFSYLLLSLKPHCTFAPNRYTMQKHIPASVFQFLKELQANNNRDRFLEPVSHKMDELHLTLIFSG